jgi:hypothetical protein
MGDESQIASVLIIANYQKPEAEPLAKRISSFLSDRGIEVDVFGFPGGPRSAAIAYMIWLSLSGATAPSCSQPDHSLLWVSRFSR